mmetsp:Transcript_22714/g.70235  ORF Transcript_22714/g.70235 Transcript_22714/m.70235 type:complete len:117 (+) Transcript_22714:486-836(+)
MKSEQVTTGVQTDHTCLQSPCGTLMLVPQRSVSASDCSAASDEGPSAARVGDAETTSAEDLFEDAPRIVAVRDAPAARTRATKARAISNSDNGYDDDDEASARSRSRSPPGSPDSR